MKKLYLALMVLSLFALSGCGGGSSSSVGQLYPRISPDVKEVIVLSSPAFERNKRYRIYTGATLSGMNGAKYFVSNTGSEAVQSTLNLGFSQTLDPNESFIIVNDSPDSADHSGGIVFAYDPSAASENFTSGGNVSFNGGSLMYYRTLSLSDSVESANDNGGHTESTTPLDADTYAEFESERGVTTFAIGRGTYLSFVVDDEESYLPRDIPEEGYILRLVHKVNTFSGIIKR